MKLKSPYPHSCDESRDHLHNLPTKKDRTLVDPVPLSRTVSYNHNGVRSMSH